VATENDSVYALDANDPTADPRHNGVSATPARSGAGGPGAWTWPPLPMWTRRVFNCSAT
jgi:hypothetical protein